MTAPARIVAPGAPQATPAPSLARPLVPFPGPGGAGDPLGNNATNVSGGERLEREERRRLYRALRYRLRGVGQAVARANSNVSKCGRVRVKVYGVEVRQRGDGSAYFAGIVQCGSVWECPVCSARVTAHRAADLRVVVGAHRCTGGGVYLLTLTTPHDQGDELKRLRQTVANAWRFVCSGRAWMGWRERIGLVGTVRAAEATVGPNGWHPHLHVLIFTKAPLDPATIAAFQEYVYTRWGQKVTAAGYRAPSREHGVNLVESKQDDYVAKLGLADEVASGTFKTARSGRRAPLAVLADYMVDRHPADLLRWKEWCDSMRGARQMTWSRGLRERYLAERELSDLEVVAREEQGPAKVLWTITPEMWDAGVALRPDLQSKLLTAAETQGVRGVRWILCQEPYPGVPF